jgi:hypothetical protein
MQRYWVPASKTLSLVASALQSDFGAIVAICERAHAGLVQVKAELFTAGTDRHEDALLPTNFWWAEGQEALQQDWVRGDFSTWLDNKIELKAFGTQFDFEGIRSLMTPQSAAAAAREMSVASNSDWISASEARRFAYENLDVNPVGAGSPIIDQCRLGFVPARSVLMQRRRSSQSNGWNLEVREWDIPIWFWEEFTKVGASDQDWGRGVFSGRGWALGDSLFISLTGVYFERASLEAMVPGQATSSDAPRANKGGRPRKEWWDDLWCSLWGDVYRGDFQPRNQAEIERKMIEWVEDTGESVSESTVKPLARKMFAELTREGRN